MYGIKLFGIPFGDSPINPLSCAPIGLKYLNNITLHSWSALYISVKILSIITLVSPYGFVAAPTGISSVIGTFSGSPYTVADELNTILFTL